MEENNIDFSKLLETDEIKIPQAGETVKGIVVSASKSEVKLDIGGVLMGIVRGPELFNEVPEYSDLEPGEEVEATVIEEENEDGELELSFRLVGQEKALNALHEAYKKKEIISVRIVDANKGGLLSRYRQIDGFLPVSQLAPENYPRISGGDKSRILEKLKSFIGQDFDVMVITLDEEEGKIIFSEKDVWNKKQQPALDKYKVGAKVEGKITAITNFGVFVTFDNSIEGLIHISELAWQRIDSPNELYKVGEKIDAEIINIDGAKVFLSAKKLLKDPWSEASAKYKVNQVVSGSILKVNPFGLFVKLDEEIHGLAHISQLSLGPKEKITDLFAADEVKDFEVVSISPAEHRLGLRLAGKKSKKVKEKEAKEDDKKEKKIKKEEKSDKKEVKKEEKEETKKEKKAKKDKPETKKEKPEKKEK